MEKFAEQLNQIFYAQNEVYHRFAVKLKMTDMEYFTLDLLLRRGEGISQTDLVRAAGFPKQTVNTCCLRMEEDGLLTHRTGPYHSKIMELTDKGREYCKQTVGRVQEIEDTIFESWTEEEQSRFLALSKKYLSELEEKERSFPDGKA